MTLKVINNPPYKCCVPIDGKLMLWEVFQAQINWCRNHLTDIWQAEIPATGPKFWFADQNEALLFILRWG